MKDLVSHNKGAHKAMCMNSTEEKKSRCKGMRNKAKKTASETMREMAEEGLLSMKKFQQECLD